MYRVTLLSTVLFGISLGLLFFKHENSASNGPSQDNQNAFPSRRELSFPSDQSVGVLQVGRLKGPSVVLDFQQLKRIAAKGSIEVSGDDFVQLLVGSVDNLKFLEQLSPGALQGLTITGLKIDRNALALITRLEGLVSLSLDDCEFTKDTFEEAKSLSSLRAINVNSTALDVLAFAGWIATLPKLEQVYARPALDALAYQKLSGHPALATTTIDVANDQSEWPLEQLRLPALRELIINCEDNASARALDGFSALKNLESISISSGTVDGDFLKRVGAIGSVRKLQLIYNKVGSGFFDGLETLNSVDQLVVYPSRVDGSNLNLFKRQLVLAILKLPRIKTIPQIRKPSLQMLEQVIARSSIESLDIDEWDDRVPISKLEELCAHKELKTLKLSYVPISDDQLQILSGLEGLEELSLRKTDVQGHGLKHLSNLPKLRQLLIMNDTQVKPNLSGLSHLSRLERLQIFGYGFSSEDYFPIAECHSLHDVSISEGEINDALVMRLATLPNLASIGLTDSSMTDKGARALACNQNLESVNLTGMISRDAVAEFAKLPKLSGIFVRSSELEPIDCVDLQFEFPSVGKLRFSRKEH